MFLEIKDCGFEGVELSSDADSIVCEGFDFGVNVVALCDECGELCCGMLKPGVDGCVGRDGAVRTVEELVEVPADRVE